VHKRAGGNKERIVYLAIPSKQRHRRTRCTARRERPRSHQARRTLQGEREAEGSEEKGGVGRERGPGRGRERTRRVGEQSAMGKTESQETGEE
jgi:hypothetical protein